MTSWMSRAQATESAAMFVAGEDRHDLVADIFVDVAVVLGDEVGQALEVVVEHLDHRLGIARFGERGVAADVGEEDRHLRAARRRA